MSTGDSTKPPEPVRSPEAPVERILRAVWDRMHERNQHFVGVCVGREGIGKSHTSITIARAIDPDFSSEQVLFGPAELLEILQDDEYEAGDMYVVDEAGVSFGSRTWQERGQVRANQALQLIRSHNIGVLFTLPRLGELDSQTQGRLQAIIELLRKREGEFVRAKWKWVQPKRGEDGGIKTPFPKIGQRKIRSIKIGPPPAELVEPYEERKATFQRETYEDAISELSDDDSSESGDGTPSATEIAEEIGDDVTEYLREINDGAQTVLDRHQIATEYDIGAQKSKRVKRLLAQAHSEVLPDNVV
jgi:hypothetical protein